MSDQTQAGDDSTHAETKRVLQDVVNSLADRMGEPVTTLQRLLEDRIADAGLPEQPHGWVNATAAELAAGYPVVVDNRTMTSSFAATLAGQHAHIRELAAAVRDTGPAEQQPTFARLCAYLSAHEAVERVFLHSAPDEGAAAQAASDRVAEEDAVGRGIAALEEMGEGDPAFGPQFEELFAAIEQHATAEEQEEVPNLVEVLTLEDVAAVQRALLRVPELAAENELSGLRFRDQVQSAVTLFTQRP